MTKSLIELKFEIPDRILMNPTINQHEWKWIQRIYKVKKTTHPYTNLILTYLIMTNSFVLNLKQKCSLTRI